MSYNSMVIGLVISNQARILNYSPITPWTTLNSVLLPLLIQPQIPLKSKWRKSTYWNITLTLTLPNFPPPPFPWLWDVFEFSKLQPPLWKHPGSAPAVLPCYLLKYIIEQRELRKYKYNWMVYDYYYISTKIWMPRVKNKSFGWAANRNQPQHRLKFMVTITQ